MSAPTEKAETSENAKETEVKVSLRDVCHRYIPLAGGASALAFSVNVMDAKIFRRYLSPYELTVSNCLWFNAHLGVGLYIYNRPIIQQAPMPRRIAYSVFGAMIFNFGSVLFWATTKTLLPKCTTVRILFGLGTGLGLIYIGRDYLQFIDSHLALE